MSQSDHLLGLDALKFWDTELAFTHLQTLGRAQTRRTAERLLHTLNILPPELNAAQVTDEFGRPPVASIINWDIEQARAHRMRVLFVQYHDLPGHQPCLHANDSRGARYWLPLASAPETAQQIIAALHQLQAHIGKPLAIFPHGPITALLRGTPSTEQISLRLLSYPPALTGAINQHTNSPVYTPHLKRLEAESIHIIREAVAEANNPAMLYSIGKDSSVMLHLARKAFYPAPPPFPLLHVDTRWKFQEMYLFRDQMARESGMELLIHINPEAIEKNINPFDHGSALHTDITKTEGLKQALDKYKFDVVFGGARRDEEKSRAKERIFSFRTQTHQWDPKNQRPELWNLYNTRINQGESIRVFPLSNWTELDIWQYIYQEHIPVVPLYFAKPRPVIERNGMLIMVDDARMPLLPDDQIQCKTVRFRTLGCYPLTGAIESDACDLPSIILELLGTRNSERQGRAIDTDSAASMERRKQEGYF
jgi:sulfate adenylyltransferase subunit 2